MIQRRLQRVLSPARLAHLLQRFKDRKSLVPTTVELPCQHCGAREAILMRTATKPDFDPSLLASPGMKEAFADRKDGICFHCGLYQAFNRFTDEQLKVINEAGKDVTTSNSNFHDYPAPSDFVRDFDTRYFSQRLDRWKPYLDSVGFNPESSLFLRPFFGATAKFVHDNYGGRLAGLDMSPVCGRMTEDRVEGFRLLRGWINGRFRGEFLETGPYDAIFVMHVLTHSCHLHEMLGQLRDMLAPGGIVVFTHEVVRKPTNPFHMVHFSEVQFVALLRMYFSRVDRIDDCDSELVPATTRFTVRGDSPDFVVWNGALGPA